MSELKVRCLNRGWWMGGPFGWCGYGGKAASSRRTPKSLVGEGAISEVWRRVAKWRVVLCGLWIWGVARGNRQRERWKPTATARIKSGELQPGNVGTAWRAPTRAKGGEREGDALKGVATTAGKSAGTKARPLQRQRQRQRRPQRQRQRRPARKAAVTKATAKKSGAPGLKTRRYNGDGKAMATAKQWQRRGQKQRPKSRPD